MALSIAEPVRPVRLAPGGEVVVRGVVRSSYDGVAYDALTATAGESRSEHTLPGGLYDLEAGGFQLVSRDLSTHTYRLAATGHEGAGCIDARVSSPCLVLRVLPLAQSRLMAAEDFARTLSGAMELEVLDPPPPPRVLVTQEQRKPLWAGAIVLMAALGAWGWRRRAKRPEVRIGRAVDRVCAMLRAGDPVHRALVPAAAALRGRAAKLAEAGATRDLDALEEHVLSIEKRLQSERSRKVAEGAESALRALERELACATEAAAEADAVVGA